VVSANSTPRSEQDNAPPRANDTRASFGKNRAVDRALVELERIVRFQRMFRTVDATSTEYEDNINSRLRGAARLALGSTDQTAQVSLKRRGARQ
jgi:hypothetical protein